MTMKNASIALYLGAMAVLSGCTASGAERTPAPLTDKQAKLLDKQLAGKTPGEAVRCISNSRHDNIIRVSDDMLLYRVSGRLVYQNKLRGSCPGLARDDDVIVTEQYGGQQCSGDIIRLVDRSSGIPGPACSLGDFVPYRTGATGS
jgi:hypothetical protein